MRRSTRSSTAAAILALASSLASGPALAGAIHVPGDYATIRAAADVAVAGDSLIVACGTYVEHSIQIQTGVTLRSETGDPDCVTVDANGVSLAIFGHNLDASTAIEGLTIRGGQLLTHGGGFYGLNADLRISDCVFTDNETLGWGGGAAFQGNSSPTLERCRFEGNRAGNAGGLYLAEGSAEVVDCVIADNTAHMTGGGVVCWGTASTPLFARCVIANNDTETLNGGGISCNIATATLESCTIYGNSANVLGGGVHVKAGGHVNLDHTIVAFTRSGHSVFCTAASTATLTCSVLFKNIDGDWVGCVADQRDQNGNFGADPLFCERENGDLQLRAGSPCAPGATACGLIGALGVACGPVSVVEESLGRVKARYRTR